MVDTQRNTWGKVASEVSFSLFNVEMKHFLPNEISEELAIFDEISCSVAEATTITGTKMNAIHYLGRKF